jgi:hypothetical protein
MMQWTNSIHASSWVGEFATRLLNQLPRMQGARYEAHPLMATEYYLIGAHGLERVSITEGAPSLDYIPGMESYRDFMRNTLSWVKVMGDVMFTTREGTRTVSFSQVLNSIMDSLGKIEGALIHAPLVDGGRHLMLYIQEPVAIPGQAHRLQYRHWQIVLPVCRIGEFTWGSSVPQMH